MSRWPSTRWNNRACFNAGPAGPGGGGPPVVPPLSVTITPLDALVQEVGAELVNPQFNLAEANVDGALTLRAVTDDDGNPAQNFLAQPNPVTMPFTYSENVIGTTRSWTYNADDGRGIASDVATITFLPRVYHGVAAIPGAINEAFVEALAENELRADKGITRNGIVWTAGQYLWWAFPQAFNPTDPTDFLVTLGGGFPGAVILAAAGVSVTPDTPNGVPILYDVWRSTGAGLGLAVDTAVTP